MKSLHWPERETARVLTAWRERLEQKKEVRWCALHFDDHGEPLDVRIQIYLLYCSSHLLIHLQMLINANKYPFPFARSPATAFPNQVLWCDKGDNKSTYLLYCNTHYLKKMKQ